MKKIVKISTSLILAFITLVTTMMTAKAAPSQIGIATARKITTEYIPNISFSYKYASDGKYLYCLNKNKNTASNIMANYVQNSSYIDGGLTYILKIGYPEKSITGNQEKDYYITQVAVWKYLDATHGTNNLTKGIKSTPESVEVINHVNNLVNQGLAHRNDPTGLPEIRLALSTNQNSLTLENDYYVSTDIKATSSNNVSKYKVTLNNEPSGTIISQNGRDFTYSSTFEVGVNDTLRIKVPASKVTSKTEITLNAEAAGNTMIVAYEYQPVDNNMQNVVIIGKETPTAGASLKLSVTPIPTDKSTVTITKVDANTKKALAGADLVLKDSTGKVISRWTSTVNAHIIRNLEKGMYTIEETKAPNGYLVNKTGKAFTISNKNQKIDLTFENTPKNVVVNINKIDDATKKQLAGAVLLVKDSTGKEIARFTTTENAYVLTDLANGTYTVQEVSAPSGYNQSNEIVSFTIDDNHLSHQITITNTKSTPVPNTASNTSLLVILVGIIMTGFGILYIKKNANN